MAHAEMNLNSKEAAPRNINRSIQLDNSDTEAYLIRGMIHFYLFQRKIDSILDYNMTLQLDSDHVLALFNRGYHT